MNVLSSEEMRTLERCAIDRGDVTGVQLMARAATGVCDAMFDMWPDLIIKSNGHHDDDVLKPSRAFSSTDTCRRALVLCGPGNNGGDGFCIASLLGGSGWHVDVFFYGSKDKLPTDARAMHDKWASRGTVWPWADCLIADAILAPDCDVVIDALFGIGLSRPIASLVAQSHHACQTRVHTQKRPVVAVDVPSGLDADTGADLGGAMCANLTVTFHTAKPAHVAETAKEYCGKVVVKDIGL